MTSKQEDQTRKIGNKKICWNFRKGRCRFGHKCTFAHDSDVASSLESASEKANVGDILETSQTMNYSIGLLSDKGPVDPMKPAQVGKDPRGDTSQLRKFDEKQMNQMFNNTQGETDADDTSRAVISNNKRNVIKVSPTNSPPCQAALSHPIDLSHRVPGLNISSSKFSSSLSSLDSMDSSSLDSHMLLNKISPMNQIGFIV